MTTRLGLDFSLAVALAADLPLFLSSLAAFISLGADVRSCLTRVGTIPHCREGNSHDAAKAGTDSRSESKADKLGAAF